MSDRAKRSWWVLTGPMRWALVVGTVASAVGRPVSVFGDEPTGLEAAVAVERAMVSAIAKCERSVVAVARVLRDEDTASDALPEPLQPGLPARFRTEVAPTHPDFVPNEFGAGVVVDRAGMILTCYHVLGDVQRYDYFVWTEHRPFPARVVAADPWFDLAVLKVDATDLHPIEFGEGDKLRKGQIVIALGNPYAIARDGEVSASWGIVSNLLRRAPRVASESDQTRLNETIHHFGTLVQTDARLNFGFSGGALVNLQGQMVALTTSYAAAEHYDAAAGLAIPVDSNFRRVVATLKRGERPEYGFLGVGSEPLSLALRQEGFRGAQVVSVVGGTPAAQANVLIGDVITQVNGRDVYDETDLFRLIGSLPSGDSAELTILRGDFDANRFRAVKRSVTLSKKHIASRRPGVGRENIVRWRGMEIDFATAAPSFSYLGPQLDARGCVYVRAVAPDSPAWRAGLRSGAFVTHVDSHRVATPSDFARRTDEAGGDVSLTVISSRGRTARYTVSP